MKRNNFFLLAVVVLFSFMEVTSCLSLNSIASNNPVQIGRFAFTLNEDNKIAQPIFRDKFGNDPAKLIPVLTDLMEENYYLYVEAAAEEGITLDVERFENEFLNQGNRLNFNIVSGSVYEFTVDPQDTVYGNAKGA